MPGPYIRHAGGRSAGRVAVPGGVGMAELTYSVTEAAKALGVSRSTMYNLIHSEGFPTFPVGGG